MHVRRRMHIIENRQLTHNCQAIISFYSNLFVILLGFFKVPFLGNFGLASKHIYEELKA